MKAYKGFSPDMTCRGFKFEEDKTYTEDKAELCKSGFHACLDPLEVLRYYDPCDSEGNLRKYHEVELEDVDDKREDDTKVCGKKITIGAELNFADLAKAHVEYVKEHLDEEKSENATGYYSAATNTGNYSAATNTGYNSAATNTGYRSAATNTGNYSAATNTGDNSAATNTGYNSAATNTGNNSAATNTGYYSAATNTGNRSAATNTGNYSAATNTGYRSAATNTGGNSAATNTGNYSAATNTGKNSVAVAWGRESKAKAAKGSYIVLAEYGEWNGEEYPILHAKMKKVDGKKIKADTFYRLKDGKFVEVEQ